MRVCVCENAGVAVGAGVGASRRGSGRGRACGRAIFKFFFLKKIVFSSKKDVCCEVTSCDEYGAIVKIEKRMSAQPT